MLKTRRISNLLLVTVFAVLLALPLAQMTLDLFDDPVIDENRSPAPRPGMPRNKRSLRAFPAAFSAWFDDHLGMRGTLVTAYRFLTQDLMRSADAVLQGNDGWLYLLRDTVGYADRLPLPADLCGRNPFDTRQLALWVEALEHNRRQVEAAGSRYVVMVVPNKQTVHDEFLPGRVRCARGPRRMEQLRQALAAHGDFPWIDLDGRFRALAADGVQLWHPTDTHWDATGAAAGYRALLDFADDALGRSLPDAVQAGRYRIVAREGSGWGLSRMLGRVSRDRDRATALEPVAPAATSLGNRLPEHARGPHRPPERFAQPQPALPTVLALHDSFFGQRFKQLAAESFSRTDFVWHRGEPGLAPFLPLVRQLRPDLVVHEMVERNLLHPYFEERP